ncbi:hypothetical protein [Rodentibacter ratti]|uniref:hypothetical protein n=1 Tax=Rodentibacter ratti TaxID=1906745 RepID=UPI000985F1AE|nr:hypothetical protein [Rodentibacter ratti]
MNKRLKAGIYATVLSLTMGGIISSQVVAQDNQTISSTVKNKKTSYAKITRILEKMGAEEIKTVDEMDMVVGIIDGIIVGVENISNLPVQFSSMSTTSKKISLDKLNNWLARTGAFPRVSVTEDGIIFDYVLFSEAQQNKKLIDSEISIGIIYVLGAAKEFEKMKSQLEE